MVEFHGNDRSRKFYDSWLRAYARKYDLVISCQTSLKMPRGALNIHYGILPHFRGCNPIYHSMMEGNVSGVTLHWTDEGWDTGNVIDSFMFPNHGMTADEVYDDCEFYGRELLIANIDRLSQGMPQNEKAAKYYYKKDVDFDKEKVIGGVFFPPESVRRVFATHFKGKQYPVINIGGRDFELRAKE